MISAREALERMWQGFAGDLGCERVGLGHARERVLARPVPARYDSPPFDNSAMDGYAVRAEDVHRASAEAPVSLEVIGESRAGGPAAPALRPHTAVRIFTGAVIPPGSDAVVAQEDTTVSGRSVNVSFAPKPGAHVRPRAEDVTQGAELLPAGLPLGPPEIGLLASQGHAAVVVRRRPVVALFSAGDELRDVGEALELGCIVNSNAYALAAMVEEAGAVPWVLPNAPDDATAIEEALARAEHADVIVTCGGVSVGDYDLMHDAFRKLGVALDFWKVAIKPGKPVVFGRARSGAPVVGLPGNPVSAMVTFEALVRPCLRRLLGVSTPFRRTVDVVLGAEFRHRPGRLELARSTLAARGQVFEATLTASQGSGSLTSMVGADALLMLSAERELFPAGEVVRAMMVRDPVGSADSPFRP